jgi:predicted ATPase
MRIKSIRQGSFPYNDGLSTIDIRGLNHIVIVAGANGSGKSRLLQRVQKGGHPGYQSLWEGHGFELEFVNQLVAPGSIPIMRAV